MGILKQINRSGGGLPKRAVTRPVMLLSEGIEGDWHNHPAIHGGSQKAVLIIAAETIAELAEKGYPVVHGSLGENLTVGGLDPADWRAGQRYRIGEDAVIELTTLRGPCGSLDVFGPSIKGELRDARCKAGDTSSPVWARGGFYARVIRPGLIVAGAPVVLESEQA